MLFDQIQLCSYANQILSVVSSGIPGCLLTSAEIAHDGTSVRMQEGSLLSPTPGIA
jgi:hypothetical protein